MPSLCARTSRLFSPFFVDLSSQFHTESNEPSIFGQFGHSVQLQQTAVYWIGGTSGFALLRVRELPRCCACMLALRRCVLALQRLSHSARERAAALFLSPAHATYRAVFGGLACDAVCWRWRCGPHARVLARGSFVCAWLMTGRDVSIVALVSLRRGIFNKTP